MSATIDTKKISLLCNALQGDSTVPDFSTTLLGNKFRSELDEDDGLFLNYAPRGTSFPYLPQNRYSRELKEQAFDAVVLENEYLKATVLPALGGRLYSLYDKEGKRELLYRNPVIRFGNLALRNAWFAGGIEWNCGVQGHTPYTCSPVYATINRENKILRLYEYERTRGVTYQVDLSLPEGAKFLHCRMKIYNPHDFVVPMYWWSNVAVRTGGNGLRTVVPAKEAYTNLNYTVVKVPVPTWKGIDITYPENSPNAIDYFWKTKGAKTYYMSAIDGEGNGLVQCSSNRLQGRKLFVWGKGKGAEHWQEWLSGEGDNGRYCEIQAGLAPTQYESLPMPPQTAWEWVELYGAISIDPQKAHGDYQTAQREVENFLQNALPEGYAEQYLTDTKQLSITPFEETVSVGSPWGWLENERRRASGEPIMSAHLQFSPREETNAWEKLLKVGSFGEQNPNVAPQSYMLQREWTEKMQKAVRGREKENWYAHFQLGCSYLAQGELKRAENRLKKANLLTKSPYIQCALAQCYYYQGNMRASANSALEASENSRDKSVHLLTATTLFRTEQFEALYRFCKSSEFFQEPRLRLYLAYSAVKTGKTEEAEEILNSHFVLPDVQESEVSLGEIWFSIQENRAKKRGEQFERKYEKLPYEFSFQMVGDE